MIRTVALIGLLSLGACGGSSYSSSNAVTSAATGVNGSLLFAQGPISRACMSAGRKQASRVRCGCVQAVADQSLTAADQRRGARFFGDPHKAQETRQSDNPANEAFWLRWKAFGQSAGRICS